MAFQFDPSPITALERPGQAVENLLVGDVDAAWRAMLEPQTLGPEERDALLNKWGIAKDSFKAKALETISNPAVLAAIAGTFIWPIPSAKSLQGIKNTVTGMMERVPLLRGFAGARAAFRGTNVPEILDDIEMGVSKWWEKNVGEDLGGAYQKFAQDAGHLPNVKEQINMARWVERLHEKPLVGYEEAGILYPNLEAQMTQPMRELAIAVRSNMESTREALGSVGDKIAAAEKRMADRGFKDPDISSLASFTGKNGFEGIEDYFPHRVMRSELDIRNLRQAAIAAANGQEFKNQSQYKMINWLGREFYHRKGAMIPDLQELMIAPEAVDKAAYMKLTNLVKDRLVDGMEEAGMSTGSVASLARRPLDEILSKGGDLVQEGERDLFATALADNMPTSYSSKLTSVLEQYHHSVARTMAWTVEGNGEKMLGELQTAKLLAKEGLDARAAWRSNMLENNIIPSALGRATPRQAANAGLWDQRVGEMIAWMDRPSVRNVVGDKFVDWARDLQLSGQGAFSLRNISMKASSYFYGSTLFANPSAAFKNTFQQILGVAEIGAKNQIAGQLEVAKRAEQYFGARFTDKLGHVEALAKVFPEFAEARLAGTPLTEEFMGRAFDSAYRLGSNAPAGISTWEKIQRAGMSLFTATETNNRLATFYGAMAHAAESKLAGGAAIDYARKIVERTQYSHSLAGTPMHFLPAGALSNPLLRQLAQFPMRTLEFVTEGIGSPDWPLAAGRLSRAVLASYITAEVADVFKINAWDATIGGMLPTFTPINEKGNILAPLPIVPPVVALGAGIASTLSGDWETLHRQLPLLIPGGVGLSRAVGMIPGPANIPQTIARSLGRKYADYEGANPLTGRIPVYTGQGSLTGYYSPWEITKYALGIHGGDIDQEAQLASRLTKDADLMKEHRQSYVDALFANDPRKAAGIESQYEARFGHKIALTSQQIEQMQERRKLTRVERELAALPREARPQYQAAISQTGVAGAVSSGLRKPMVGPTPSYTNDMGVLDTLDPYAISRYRNIPQSFPTD